MRGNMNVEVSEHGIKIQCCMVSVDDFDKAQLMYYIGKVLKLEPNDFLAIGELMRANHADALFSTGETTAIDLSHLKDFPKGGIFNV